MAANSTNAPAPVLSAPGPFPIAIPEPGTSSLWDRLSNWASENKGVVYTIAGVTLVVGAGGAIYYLSSNDSTSDGSAAGSASNKRKKQRDRKRAKERAEKEAAKEEPKAGMRSGDDLPSGTARTDQAAESKKASVAPAAQDELPEVDENSVAALSEDVRSTISKPTPLAD
jgi:import receptor subunit TOM70